MTNERPDDESQDEFSPRDEIDAVFGYGHPNPERVGCPPQEVLARLARRTLPIDHPGYGHVAECSPCYRWVRLLRKHRRQRIRRLRVGAVCLLLIGLVITWLVAR